MHSSCLKIFRFNTDFLDLTIFNKIILVIGASGIFVHTLQCLKFHNTKNEIERKNNDHNNSATLQGKWSIYGDFCPQNRYHYQSY